MYVWVNVIKTASPKSTEQYSWIAKTENKYVNLNERRTTVFPNQWTQKISRSGFDCAGRVIGKEKMSFKRHFSILKKNIFWGVPQNCGCNWILRVIGVPIIYEYSLIPSMHNYFDI